MEVVSLLGIVDDQVAELAKLHKSIFTESLIHAEELLLVERLLRKFEYKFKKDFRNFNILERSEVEKEFIKKMNLIYKKYM